MEPTRSSKAIYTLSPPTPLLQRDLRTPNNLVRRVDEDKSEIKLNKYRLKLMRQNTKYSQAGSTTKNTHTFRQ